MKLTKINISNRTKIKSLNHLYQNNNKIYYGSSISFWWKYEYDQNNNHIYSENNNGGWWKYEYDQNNNLTYRESSRFGITLDKRNEINKNKY